MGIVGTLSPKPQDRHLMKQPCSLGFRGLGLGFRGLGVQGLGLRGLGFIGFRGLGL